MSKTKPKPDKADKSPDRRNFTPAASFMGGNWATAHYLTEAEAEAAAAWIREGRNWKFSCGGRHDAIKSHAAPSGRTVWSVHYHLDNSQNPPLVNADLKDL